MDDATPSTGRKALVLEHEFAQVAQQLGPRRGDATTFFAFADTVTTRSYRRPENGRGWVGIRFPASPHASPSARIGAGDEAWEALVPPVAPK